MPFTRDSTLSLCASLRRKRNCPPTVENLAISTLHLSTRRGERPLYVGRYTYVTYMYIVRGFITLLPCKVVKREILRVRLIRETSEEGRKEGRSEAVVNGRFLGNRSGHASTTST